MSRGVKLSELPPQVRRKVKSKVMAGEELSEREKVRRKKERELRKAEADAIRAEFRLMCRDAGLPMPATEYMFAKESLGRDWRFDYAWIEERVALEVDGGLFVYGGHNRGGFILKTHDKQNAAATLGWRILHCVPKTLRTPETIALVRRTLNQSEAA